MSRDDFIVSAHALDRFQERFPDLYENDQQAAELMHQECEEALVQGRASFVPPLELALNDLDRWEAGKGLTVWTPSKERGYVLLESPEGMLVATVLIGRSTKDARRRLYSGERIVKNDADPQNDAAEATPRLASAPAADSAERESAAATKRRGET